MKQVLTFMDGTTRTETIVSQTDFNTNVPKFAAFDAPGSLFSLRATFALLSA